MIHTRTAKRYHVKTPGARNVIHIKQKKQSALLCVSCSAKLNRRKLTLRESRKLCKSEKRPQRPFPELCSSCMRKHFKNKVR
jgi:large subunit ribosomal protein L34e